MPKVRSFAAGSNVVVEVHANDDRSIAVAVMDAASRRTYRSLEEFQRLAMGTFRSLYAQRSAAQDLDNMQPGTARLDAPGPVTETTWTATRIE